MTDKHMRLLFRSFDDVLDEKEERELREALTRSASLRDEKARLIRLRELLGRSGARSFSAGFRERLARRLATAKAEPRNGELLYLTLLTVFRRFAVAGAVALGLLLAYNLILGDRLSAEEAFFASEAASERLRQLPWF